MPRTPRGHQVVQGAGLLAAVLSLVVMTQITDHSVGYYRGGSLLFAVGVAAMILASIQPVRSPVGSFLSLTPLRWTGLISYGLYLWHWPINTFMTEGRVGVSGDMLNLLRLFVTFLFAIASYYLVENPIRRGVIGRRTARLVTPAADRVRDGGLPHRDRHRGAPTRLPRGSDRLAPPLRPAERGAPGASRRGDRRATASTIHHPGCPPTSSWSATPPRAASASGCARSASRSA